jgi:hypothetical protein
MWICNYPICPTFKVINLNIGRLLSLLEIPSSQGREVHIDFVMMLPTTSHSHDTIITMIDGLKIYIEVVCDI